MVYVAEGTASAHIDCDRFQQVRRVRVSTFESGVPNWARYPSDRSHPG
jgi:hypothetical protein